MWPTWTHKHNAARLRVVLRETSMISVMRIRTAVEACRTAWPIAPSFPLKNSFYHTVKIKTSLIWAPRIRGRYLNNVRKSAESTLTQLITTATSMRTFRSSAIGTHLKKTKTLCPSVVQLLLGLMRVATWHAVVWMRTHLAYRAAPTKAKRMKFRDLYLYMNIQKCIQSALTRLFTNARYPTFINLTHVTSFNASLAVLNALKSLNQSHQHYLNIRMTFCKKKSSSSIEMEHRDAL